MLLRCSVCALFLFFVSLSGGFSQQAPPASAVPNLIDFGGTLRDTNGAPTTTVTSVTFAIYRQQEEGAPLWIETQNVAPDSGGHYTLLLGSTKAEGIPVALFREREERWLGVKAEGQPEQPRVLMVSVPYALRAAEADTLAGHDAAEFVTTETLRSAVQQQLQQQALALPSASTAKTRH